MTKVIFSLDNFINISKNINFLMKDYNITLNFEGLTTTINDFYNLDINDYYEALYLEKDFCLWQMYFSSLEQVLQYIKNDLKLVCNKRISQLSIYYSEDDKYFGDNLANKDSIVQEYQKKIKMFSIYIKEINLQLQTISKALNQCKFIYNNATNDFNRLLN